MPLLIFSVGVTEPPVARRAVHRCRVVTGRIAGVRRPDTNAPGPRPRLPLLLWARHTSCRHSKHFVLTVGKLKALLRLIKHYPRQVNN